MSLLSVLKSLLGISSAVPATGQPQSPSHEYKGFEITPEPIKKGDLYRVAATIRKGEQSHQLIRADEVSNRQSCIEISLRKAKLVIDQQGDNIFQ